jgi:hypothetical protein
MPDIHTCIVKRKRRKQEQDTVRVVKKARRSNGLTEDLAGETEPGGRKTGTRGPENRNQGSEIRWFAQGPVYLDQAVCAARRGGYAVAIWLAVRAREDSANGAPATVAWIVEATGLNDRVVRKAVTALTGIGMLRRNGRKISTS